MKTHLAISIAAYNDASTIRTVIQESLLTLSKCTDSYQVFVINDGSQDSTSQVINEIAKENPRVKVFEHEKNCGFGTTIKEVYVLPESEWVFFIPGDGQVPPSELQQLYPYIKTHSFILGWRKERNDPLSRKINSWCYNFCISSMARHAVHDVNSSALIKRESLESVQLNSRSAFIHAEIFLKAIHAGASFIEVGIRHKSRQYGRASGNKWKVIFLTVKDMLKYFFGIL